MKTIGKVLFFTILGVVAALGFSALKKYLEDKQYEEDYDDYHRHFTNIPRENDTHGIEYLQ